MPNVNRGMTNGDEAERVGAMIVLTDVEEA